MHLESLIIANRTAELEFHNKLNYIKLFSAVIGNFFSPNWEKKSPKSHWEWGLISAPETPKKNPCPESKMQSMQWKHPGSPPPKKFEGFSGRKGDGLSLWDSQGVIMIDYLEQGRTINGAYYAAELRRLRLKRRGKLRCSAFAGQCTCSHVASCHDCWDRVQI